MRYPTAERTAHVLRRLGLGSRPQPPDLGPEAAVAMALDLGSPAARPPEIAAPASEDGARQGAAAEALGFWLEQMVASPRLVEERLVWFWHDHFATSLAKVRVPYLMWGQHLTVRRHATGSFAALLHDIARDPAMLIYLDGVSNAAGAINENFGREVMELFALGPGHYTEADVVAAARSCSGWKVNRSRARDGVEPWEAVFVARLHDAGSKTLLGTTGNHDLAAAIDIILEQPACAEHIGAKLYTQLTGLDPDPGTVVRLGTVFRRDYSIMRLVEEIAADPAFLSDGAVRSRVRTPLEKALGMARAFGLGAGAGPVLWSALRLVGYAPFFPPSVAGFAAGERLLGPHQLVHTFDLVGALPRRLPEQDPATVADRLGLFALSDATSATLAAAPDTHSRIALALNSPEYTLT